MKKYISLFTFGALVLGVIVGWLVPSVSISLAFIGTFYINILKLMIVPVVFTGISSSIYKAKGNKDRIVLKSVVLFIAMFVATFLLTTCVVEIIKPYKGFVFEAVKWTGTTTNISIGSILLNLFPSDFNNFITGGKIFLTIVLAFVFGLVCQFVSIGEKLISVIDKIKEILFKFLEHFMFVTPLAVFSLIGNTVATYGLQMVVVGIKYVLTAWFCGILTILVVMIIPVSLICKISPVEYIKKVSRIWLMTLTTCSSSATLPYTIQVCKEQFGISSEITDIVVPLGCTIHMCGGAVSFALLGIFCSHHYGVEITIGKYLLMLVSSVLINMSAPGIPNGGVVIGATYLQLLGIPLDFIGFYSSIYKVLDMMYTTLNVTGDITANNLIDKNIRKGNE